MTVKCKAPCAHNKDGVCCLDEISIERPYEILFLYDFENPRSVSLENNKKLSEAKDNTACGNYTYDQNSKIASEILKNETQFYIETLEAELAEERDQLSEAKLTMTRADTNIDRYEKWIKYLKERMNNG